MSLNGNEQTLFDYLQSHPEERQFWQEKVRSAARTSADPHEAARSLAQQLGDYYRERSQVVPSFRAAGVMQGFASMTLRNLAEYLLRVWAPPPPPARSRRSRNADFAG